MTDSCQDDLYAILHHNVSGRSHHRTALVPFTHFLNEAMSFKQPDELLTGSCFRQGARGLSEYL